MRGVNDNPQPGFGGPFLPSALSLFLPTLTILSGYGVVLAGLVVAGRGDGALARLCIVVLALGGPFLIAHATLRAFTIRVAVMPRTLYVHRGFPSSQAQDIPYRLIERVAIRRGLAGRISGSGALVVTLLGGRRIVVGDLKNPDRARAAILRQMPAGERPAPDSPDGELETSRPFASAR